MRLPSLSETLPDRWRDPRLPAYPWWIPVVFFSVGFAGVCAGVAQRVGSDAFWPVAGLAVISLAPWLSDMVGSRVRYIPYGVLTMAASSIAVVRYPVEYDLLPLIWTVLAGCLGATEKYWRGKLAALACVLLVVVLASTVGLDGALLWVGGIILGWDIGVVMQFQQRRLDEQAANEEVRREQALLAERQRIAREVHDVVAHSLSVTMLHLTAARRELQEDGADGVPGAIDALRDAERVGRQAMTDIRRTVGVLAEGGPAESGANPDLADLAPLVEGFRAAGLDVSLDVRGDTGSVAPNAALALYRIAQESLANVAKHQPRSATSVLLDVTDGQRLLVKNDVHGPIRRSTDGAGLAGIAQRADLLGGTFDAGVRDGRWTIEVVVPESAGHRCRIATLLPTSVQSPAAGTA